MSNFLDEQDLKELFSGEKPKTPEKVLKKNKFTWQVAVKFFAIFVSIFITSYILINYQAVSKKTRWAFDVNIFKKTYSKAVPTPTPNPFNPVSVARLVIPKIGVDAPIIWNVDDESLKDKLLEGIVHSKDTALPGQLGNVFLTGHSSYYAWVNSDYKSVFALLDKMANNDQIYIRYSANVFVYTVHDKIVVPPDDLSVINQGDDYQLTLMTCVPIGTNLNRLIVKAKQANLSGSISGSPSP